MPSFEPTEALATWTGFLYITCQYHICPVLYAACQLLILVHPHYVYILVNLLYMRTHTHTIIHALPGFSMMFPHFSIYPCVRGLSFLYLLLNNKCSPSLYLLPLWVSTGCAAAQMILRLSCQLLLHLAYTLFSKATRKPSNSGRPCKIKAEKT